MTVRSADGLQESAVVLKTPRRRLIIAAVGLVIVLLVGGSLVDSAAASGKSRHNIEVGGIEVGGRSREQVTKAVSELAASYATTPVSIDAGSVSSASTAAELGLSIDVDAVVEDVMNSRDPAPLIGWIFDLGRSSHVDVALTVDADTARATISELNQHVNDAPIEPTVTMSNGALVAVPGRPGAGIDADAVVAELRKQTYQRLPLAIAVPAAQLSPEHDVAEAEALVADINKMTAQPLVLQAGAATNQVETEVLLTWFTTEVARDGKLRYALDTDVIANDLTTRLSAGNLPPMDAKVDIVADVPTVVPAQNGQVCCAPEAPATILTALESRLSTTPPPADAPVVVPMVLTEPGESTEDITKLGIIELVSTFTTKHKCCEARNTNIAIAADALRGTIVAPGERFSLNGKLGARTTDKGYVEAPTIQDGELVPGVGGGVSQIATTLFNTAFFAGLRFDSYQSHSIYISRYPYGREATVDYPAIDLAFTNNSPTPVLIWTAYDDTSITVSMYSTKWTADVQQGNQTKEKVGLVCTAVTTERVITFLDGTTKTDTVRARYRPEGKKCDGSPSATTTTKPPPATTTTKPGAAPTTVAAPAATTTAAPAATTVATTTTKAA